MSDNNIVDKPRSENASAEKTGSDKDSSEKASPEKAITEPAMKKPIFSELPFSELLLDEPLLEAVTSLGFEMMTEVQASAVTQALQGKDLIVNARTGSGKTLAYLLPMLQQILDNPQTISQALILAPTRELCRQINKQCSLLAQFTDIHAAVIIGGEDPKHQIKALQTFPEIIIATPGRLLEHVKREMIDLESINVLVLDEADRMLAMGFSDEVISIATQCNEECQTVLYSASYNQNKFALLTDAILYEAEVLMIDSPREDNQNIVQQKIASDDRAYKLKLCKYLLQNEKYSKAMVFANKKETVNVICGWLQSEGITSAFIHGDVDQDKRNQQLRKFRSGEINIIIATDIAARGLDISELDLVINFDVPHNGEDYMHRIGRTGRMSDNGTAITLVNANEWNAMISIENFLEIKCPLRKIGALPAKFKGPENQKSSGKAFGKKRKKAGDSKKSDKKTKSRTKNRVRDKKNIGKRRQPSAKHPGE